uniref:Major facilitator superfamily (MFS) profile domain-containing protein n=1 Tax=Acrobeloides nanus TaxID=290746 RepID=A0A914DPP7_9BILA
MVLRPAANMPSDRDSSPSDHIELEENCDNNLSIIDQDVAVVEIQSDFGVYQLVLFVITQLGYLPVAGGMLSTTFFEPTKEFCMNPKVNSSLLNEFQSLLMEWNEHCQHSSLVIITSTIVMLGAVVGTMLILFLSHGALILSAAHLKWFALILFFTIGCSSGGYIVVNLVLMVESLEKASSRLLVVSLNGWPIESVRWLINHGRLRKADKVQVKINNRNKLSPFNSSSYLTVPAQLSSAMKKVTSSNSLSSAEIKAMKNVTNDFNSESPLNESTKIAYTYYDLFRYSSILFPLLALSYSFTSSSIISFGFYFTIEVLPGNRYVNLAAMGLLKLCLGFLPFVFSIWFGRRPIFLVSIGVACISSAILVVCQIFFHGHWAITILSLLITASMDPAWKINHLYSAELFPTVVRNMCRAICNVGARFGSLIAPGIIHMRHQWELLPYLIFFILLTGQFIIGLTLLPETKDRPLLDELPEKSIEKTESHKNDSNAVL